MININSKYNNYNIIIVGLGGTGSHLISFLSQLIGNRKDKELFKITLIDRYEYYDLANSKTGIDFDESTGIVEVYIKFKCKG